MWLSLLLGSYASSARAQSQADPPVAIGDVTVFGSLRTRSYSWNWFGASPNGDYTYPGSLARLGFSQSKKPYDWQLELALPLLLNLPSTAVAPPPQGQLGLGATYLAANDGHTNTAALFLKQGFVRVKGIGGIQGQSLAIGRMEFNDGTEVTPTNVILAALKRDRISQRLLGTFGYSDVGRSLDGAQYRLTSTKLNVTVLGGRATQGVFQVDGWPELKVTILYGALTGQLGGDQHPAEWRVFGLGYDDYRHGVVKADNRVLTTRTADTDSIAIGTYGGHYLQLAETRAGPVDLLFWGAVQTGAWGALTQRAGAFAAEAGFQPVIFDSLKPWVRGGYDYGSGDGNATDQRHGTFFQVLPTPRVYARLPFFNMMNTRDGFGELVLSPSRRLTVRTDVHVLRLADTHDLWYSGGGAFQPETFGYTGRPSNGQSGLATLYDASGDYSVNPHFALGIYYGYAGGHAVAQAIYPAGTSAHFGYVEVLLRF
ncbi:MAG: hypothetical protein DMF89_07545 [Acidobacteria bacterium]|nr:MAG: hypothetical protein DMF89_07545 [Acidobacteriota bacterium]